MRRYLIDENLSPTYREQLLDYEPLIKVLKVGDKGAPARSISDPDILKWCEKNDFNLITNNRKSMPQHLSDHLLAGHHVTGIFTINLEMPMGTILDDLILIASASDDDEYTDEIVYIPL